MGHAFEVAYGVLGEAAGPAADYGYLGLGQGTEYSGQFEACDGGGLVVATAHEAFGGCTSEEGSDEATAYRDTMRKLLVHEGGGEEEAP